MTNYIVELLEDSGLWEPIGCYSDLGQAQDMAASLPNHARIVEDREKSLRFRVERWVEDRGWVCIVEESEWGWAEVAVYTGLALYDGDLRVVDTEVGTCNYYRRGRDDED